MRLEATEFLRRFLQHVLPSGFQKVRHYGYLVSVRQGRKSASAVGRTGGKDSATVHCRALFHASLPSRLLKTWVAVPSEHTYPTPETVLSGALLCGGDSPEVQLTRCRASVRKLALTTDAHT
jgi:hypothetical protein